MPSPLKERIATMTKGIEHRRTRETRWPDGSMASAEQIQRNVRGNAIGTLPIELRHRWISEADAQEVLNAYNSTTGEKITLEDLINNEENL